MEKKKALITGITGQDGSYLAEFLLKKGYEVHGIVRRASTFNRERIEHLTKKDKFFEGPGSPHIYYGDLTDSSSIRKIMKEVMPNEIYNLGAQSHVGISFEIPENTSDITALGTLRLLDAMKDICPKAKFYQASSSEMFGETAENFQSEKTSFHPRSPYGCSKVYAYYITINYREAYGLHASNGILFNHESERRGENFVTRKITKRLAEIKLGIREHLFLGNLDAKRDWGHAEDYVEAMWLILQQDEPDDYVIGTGETHSVREFLEEAAKVLGMNIKSNGKKGKEEEYINENGKAIVKIDPEYIRPAEVDSLCADSTKAKIKLGWVPKTKFKTLVKRMVEYDLKSAQKEAYLCGKEKDVGEKIASAIKPLLEFADRYGINIPPDRKNEEIKVAISGYFDPIHRGHIDYFRLAKELAGKNGKLIAILNNDKQAELKKGKSFMSIEDKKAALESIKYIDEVFISIDEDNSVCKSLEMIKPHIFAKGGDRYAEEIPEAKICRRLNIKIVDGLGKKIQSSSELLKNYFNEN